MEGGNEKWPVSLDTGNTHVVGLQADAIQLQAKCATAWSLEHELQVTITASTLTGNGFCTEVSLN